MGKRLIDANALIAEYDRVHIGPAGGARKLMEDAPTIEPYGTWIPCSERLPEEKINPITQDYYEYPVTAVFGDVKDIRYYKFGNGHWWHGGGIVDERVIAWMPLPEPYREEKKDE